MTDFRDLLKVIQSHGSGGKSFRMFEALEMGPFRLSIQASYAHYCSPRVTLENLKNYLSWEMMLYEKGKPEINPIQDSRFTDVGVEDWSDIGAHIPTAIVQALYERCRMLFVTMDLSPQCKQYKNLKCDCNGGVICNNALTDPNASTYAKEAVVIDSITAASGPGFGDLGPGTCVICGAKGKTCAHLAPKAPGAYIGELPGYIEGTIPKESFKNLLNKLADLKPVNFGLAYPYSKLPDFDDYSPEFWENYEGGYKKAPIYGAPHDEFVVSPLSEYNFEDINKKLMAKWAPELLEAASPKAEVTDVKVGTDGVVTMNVKLPIPSPYLDFHYTIPYDPPCTVKTGVPCGVCDDKGASYEVLKKLAEESPIPVIIGKPPCPIHHVYEASEPCDCDSGAPCGVHKDPNLKYGTFNSEFGGLSEAMAALDLKPVTFPLLAGKDLQMQKELDYMQQQILTAMQVPASYLEPLPESLKP